jgi:dCTP deaminase
MILTDWEIRKAIEDGDIGVDPFDESLINPASLDIRLGDMFSLTEAQKTQGKRREPYVDPMDKESFNTLTFKVTKDYYLPPRRAVLASMMEKTVLSDNISVKLFGKSSLARLGLMNSPDACWVDCGWVGQLTMELFNSSDFAIRLVPGMKIGQLVFFKHKRASKPYNLTGRYSNQVPGMGSLGI